MARPLAALGAFVLVLTGCSGGQERSVETWLHQTAMLLQQPVQNFEDEFFVQPYLDTPGGELNPYRVATSMAAMASSTLDLADAERALVDTVSSYVSGDTVELPSHPLYVLEMVVRADQSNAFMSEAELEIVASALDTLMKSDPPVDSIDFMVAAKISDYVSSGDSSGFPVCADADADDAFFVLASRATEELVGRDAMDCDPGNQLWQRELDALNHALADEIRLLDTLDCDVLLSLSLGASSEEDLQRLEEPLNYARQALSEERVTPEPTGCLAALQQVSRVLGVQPLALTPAQYELLNWQIQGGGPPVVVPATPRVIDAISTLSAQQGITRPESQAELAWLAQDDDGTLFQSSNASIGEASDIWLAALKEGDRDNQRFALKTIALNSVERCDELSDSGLFSEVGRAATESDGDPITRAMALRVLDTCEVGESQARISLEIERALQTLGNDLASLQIEETYTAQSVLCVLKPEHMRDRTDIWAAYSGLVSQYGGLVNGGESISQTLDLASLLIADKESCEEGTFLW